jgi:hypothetical protein
VYLPKGILEREKLDAAIAEIKPLLGKDVVRLKHTIEENWSGQPSIYFRILLTDRAAKPPGMYKTARRIEHIIEEHIDPINSWDLIPYYRFRSQSEQKMLKEAAWA